MEESLNSKIRNCFNLTAEADIRTVNPLTLAYIGDCIYEMVMRTVMTAEHNTKAGQLHRMTTKYVKADAQSEMMKTLEPVLTEEELAVFHRGRNAKSGSSAKNADIGSYRRATGFEAVMGYLYLTEQVDRMLELIKLAYDNYTPSENEGTEARNHKH